MSSQGPNGPGTATTSNANGGTLDWANPTNCEADDGSFTVAGDGASTGTSYYLKATNFGFTVPAFATIDGIVVEVKRKSGIGSPSGTTDSSVMLLDATGTLAGDEKADTVTNWPDTTATYATYGSSSDRWSLAPLTPVNNSNFGIAVAATITSGTNTAQIDYIRVTVYYTPPAGSHQFQTRVVRLDTPPAPGGVIAIQTAPTAGPATLPTNTLAIIIQEKPQPPRFAGRVLAMPARFETARRQAPTRVDSAPPLPTASGGVVAFGSRQPTAPSMGRERIRVVYDPAAPPAPGRVTAFAYPALPTVRLPTGQRLVIRDIDPPPFAGRVVTRSIPVRDQLPTTPARAVPLLPPPAPGRVVSLSTRAEPRPRAPFAAVVCDPSPRLPGRVAAFRTVDTAAPAGALVPRAIIIRELAPTPPFVGRVRVSAKAPHDFTLPILTPIFLSAAPPEYTSRAADHYNSSGPRTFVARRVP